MPEIAFHFNAADKLHYACRYTRKALRSGARVVIAGALPTLQTLDAMLWRLDPCDFIAHAVHGCDPQIWHASPVVLVPDTHSPALDSPHQEVLLNMGPCVPPDCERFQKVVEVVAQSDLADRHLARQRWRQYEALGYRIVRHDLVSQVQTPKG